MVVLRAYLLGSIASAGLLLAACAGHDSYVNVTAANTTSAGEWRIEKWLDRITGAPISSAFVVTNRVSNSNIIVPPTVKLQLACFKEHAAVIIAFGFKIGSTRNAEVGYRFDDKPGHEPRVRIVEDYKTALIEDPIEVAQFISELTPANALLIRIRSFTGGRTTADFKVAGAPAAIAAAYAGCPLTGSARTSALPPAPEPDKED
jgi:hypothetical protein